MWARSSSIPRRPSSVEDLGPVHSGPGNECVSPFPGPLLVFSLVFPERSDLVSPGFARDQTPFSESETSAQLGTRECAIGETDHAGLSVPRRPAAPVCRLTHPPVRYRFRTGRSGRTRPILARRRGRSPGVLRRLRHPESATIRSFAIDRPDSIPPPSKSVGHNPAPTTLPTHDWRLGFRIARACSLSLAVSRLPSFQAVTLRIRANCKS